MRNCTRRAGEIAQRLEALTAPAETQVWFPELTWQLTLLLSLLPGDPGISSALQQHHKHLLLKHTYRHHIKWGKRNFATQIIFSLIESCLFCFLTCGLGVMH